MSNKYGKNGKKEERDFPEIVVDNAASFICPEMFKEVCKEGDGKFFHSDRPNEMTLSQVHANEHSKKEGRLGDWLVEGKTTFYLKDGKIIAEVFRPIKGDNREFYLLQVSDGVCALIKEEKKYSVHKDDLHLELMRRINEFHAENQRRTY